MNSKIGVRVTTFKSVKRNVNKPSASVMVEAQSCIHLYPLALPLVGASVDAVQK